MEETRKDKLQLIVRRFFLIITDIILVNEIGRASCRERV